jgi:hypothetical protein
MKANEFAIRMAHAGPTHRAVSDKEPIVVVREGTFGKEFPVKTVKVKAGVIILEYEPD